MASATFWVIVKPRLDVFGPHEGEAVIPIGIGTHAARVGPLVAHEAPLVVLDGRSGHDGLSVGDALQGKLLALELFLDHHGGVLLQDLSAILEGLLPGLEVVTLDLHALAAGEPVGLHDDARELLQKCLDPVNRGEGLVAGVAGDVVFADEVPREGFGCLESGELLFGSHGGDSCGRERIDDAQVQGVFRPDDGELAAVLLREGHDGRQILVGPDEGF